MLGRMAIKNFSAGKIKELGLAALSLCYKIIGASSDLETKNVILRIKLMIFVLFTYYIQREVSFTMI